MAKTKIWDDVDEVNTYNSVNGAGAYKIDQINDYLVLINRHLGLHVAAMWLKLQTILVLLI